MYELLKKFGMTSAIAGLVAALVTVVPLIFKVDDRYAKDDDVALLTRQIAELSVLVGELAGTQKVLVAIIASTANKIDKVHSVTEVIKLRPVDPLILPVPPVNKPVPTPVITTTRDGQLNETLNILNNAQRRLKEIQDLRKLP